MSRLLDALRSGRVLLMDGAMGTELQRAGLKPGECGELWNLTQPEKVRAIHQAYVDAGTEVLLTNSFQANPASLARHDLEDQLAMICQAAVNLARDAAGPDRWVLGDIGPLQGEESPSAWRKVVNALAAAGVDGLFLETCDNPEVVGRFLWSLAADPRRRPPLLASFTFWHDREHRVRTIDGLPPSEAARGVEHYAVAAIGVNCGRDMGMPQVLEVVEAYCEQTWRRIFVRPNAGTPKQVEDRWVYPHTPQYMASWLPELLEAGVSMVGGCCGTTPEHIAAFRPIIDEWNRKHAATSR